MGGPPRSGMVVCRPLLIYGAPCRKPLAPPNADLATRALCRQNTQVFFEFLCFPQHLHFPDSGMGRYSRVWNGGFQAFAARPAGNPLAPKCRPCHLRLMQTTPYSPSNHYFIYLPPTLPGFRDASKVWNRGLQAFTELPAGNPWHPPMQTLQTRHPNSFPPGFRWGGAPRYGMVFSRPLRRGLPETPSAPHPCHSSISFRLDILLT